MAKSRVVHQSVAYDEEKEVLALGLSRRVWRWAPPAWAAITAGALALLPAYGRQSDSLGPGVLVPGARTWTGLAANPSALVSLLVPLALSLAPLLARPGATRKIVTRVAVALLGAYCLLGVATVGLFFLPSFFFLTITALPATEPRGNLLPYQVLQLADGGLFLKRRIFGGPDPRVTDHADPHSPVRHVIGYVLAGGFALAAGLIAKFTGLESDVVQEWLGPSAIGIGLFVWLWIRSRRIAKSIVLDRTARELRIGDKRVPFAQLAAVRTMQFSPSYEEKQLHEVYVRLPDQARIALGLFRSGVEADAYCERIRAVTGMPENGLARVSAVPATPHPGFIVR